MARWAVDRATGRGVDYSEDDAERWESERFDVLPAAPGAKPPADDPKDYERQGPTMVKAPRPSPLRAACLAIEGDVGLPAKVRDLARELRAALERAR